MSSGDRFQEELPSNLSHMMHIWGDDEIPAEELEACLYCGRKGGTPVIVIADETHCTRCFEDFTEAQFAEYLEESGAGSVMREGPATRIGVGSSNSVVPGHDAVSVAVEPWGPGHPLYTVAVNVCGNCTQTAKRLTDALCDECMEEAVARVATQDLLMRAGCTSAESAAYMNTYEEVA